MHQQRHGVSVAVSVGVVPPSREYKPLAVAHLVRGLAALLREDDADLAAVDAHAVEPLARVVGVALGLELNEREALGLSARASPTHMVSCSLPPLPLNQQ